MWGQQQAPIDFGKEIQPIFVTKCYACHGPAEAKGGLRFDRRSDALRGGENGPVIVPHGAAKSELLLRVSSKDASERMPPKGEALSPRELELLQKWLDAGANWPDEFADNTQWWSLKGLKEVPPPEVSAAGQVWANTPVDRFIWQELAKKNLQPAPEATRTTLIRRLSFDLLGLPPTPEQVQLFLNDPAPDAYEKLVERLLASPHYGERWARHWLDLVHYGDTHGYDKDKPRPNAWPYRDYVIRALNADKPYARFIQEQLAGDAMFPGTVDGIEALGFIAAGPWDFIGHAEVPESKIDGRIARHLDRDDMVATTMMTFNSLTVQCANCHHHKFDPISQQDYYQLQAVFAALDRADRPYDRDPQIARQRGELNAQLNTILRTIAEYENKMKAQSKGAWDQLQQQLQAKPHVEGNVRAEFGYHSKIEAKQESEKWVEIDLGSDITIDQIVLHPCFDDFNKIGAGFGFPVRFLVEVRTSNEKENEYRVVGDFSKTDLLNPGLQPVTIAVSAKQTRFIRVRATKLAPRQNDFIFAMAEVEAFSGSKLISSGKAVRALDSIEAPPRWQKKNLTDGVFAKAAVPTESVQKLRQRLQELAISILGEAGWQEYQQLQAKITETRQSLAKLPPPQMVYAGTVHQGNGAFRGTGPEGNPRPIYLLNRGDIRQPGKEVAPGAITQIQLANNPFPIAENQPESARRVALAKWLTATDNPLTWRSMANRVWMYHFGEGLVSTPNDFGKMGQLPTHPELLDWLACELRRTQSIKHLHRVLVLSSTYRQQVVANAAAERVDASNRLYWRMNRRKLEAEAVRDSILAMAGKLRQEMGGPAFQDFQVEKPQHSPHYQYHLANVADPNLHRRSIYRFLVRSQQQPLMTVLDCADPSMQVEKRSETQSPLQALALLNDRLILAMVQHFADRLKAERPTLRGQLQYAWELAFARTPTEMELQALENYTQQHGLENACRVLTNLNEFIFID